MPMTVAELRDIVSVDITGVTISNLDSLSIIFTDVLGVEKSVTDAGDYDIIISNASGDTIESNFVFIAGGSGSTISYENLKEALENAEDTNYVYFLSKRQTLPSADPSLSPVEGASLLVTRLTSVSESLTSNGILTLSELPLSSSSSSSS